MKLKRFIHLAVIAGLLLQNSFLAGNALATLDEGVKINEFNKNAATGEWVELINTSDSDINLTGWTIKKLATPTTANTEDLFATLSGTIPAHGIRVFQIAAGENLLNDSNESIALYNGATLKDRVNYGSSIFEKTATANLETAPTATASLLGTTWTKDVTTTKGWFNDTSITPAFSSLVSNIPASITSNLSDFSSNPSKVTGLYFDKEDLGRVTFTGEINLTDSNTIHFLRYLSIKLQINTGSLGILSSYAPKSVAHISLYNVDKLALGTQNPGDWTNANISEHLLVADDNGNLISPSSDKYPELNVIGYASGTFSFTTDHFTTFTVKQLPAKPTLNLNKITNDNTPTFSWKALSASYQVDGYDLYIDNVLKYSGLETSYVSQLLADGDHTWKLRAHNSLGWGEFSTSTTKVDTVAPSGSFTINDGASVTNEQKVNLKLNAVSDTKYMAISNSNYETSCEESNGNWIDYATTYQHSLTPEKGVKTVYVRFKDQAGNISPTYTQSIYFNQEATDIKTEKVKNIETKTYGNVSVTLEATEEIALTYAKFNQTPETQPKFSAFGSYFDLSVSDASKVKFPSYIKIYYTLSDLEKANIKSEDKISGLYFYNREAKEWQLYSDTGVNTTDEGQYAGYVWANADHFTPMVLGADLEAPVKPTNFKAQSLDGKVKLSWDKIPDASGYYVRYRLATNDDNSQPYTEVYVDNGQVTELTIENLTNGKMYEFGIRAVDKAQNKGEWAVVEETPKKTIDQSTPKTNEYNFGYIADNSQDMTGSDDQTNQNKDEQTQDENKDQNKDSQGSKDEDKNQTTSNTKLAVIIGIVIIAVGAAIGGYYGYQWWMESAEEEVTPTEKPKQAAPVQNQPKKGKNKKNRRW